MKILKNLNGALKTVTNFPGAAVRGLKDTGEALNEFAQNAIDKRAKAAQDRENESTLLVPLFGNKDSDGRTPDGDLVLQPGFIVSKEGFLNLIDNLLVENSNRNVLRSNNLLRAMRETFKLVPSILPNAGDGVILDAKYQEIGAYNFYVDILHSALNIRGNSELAEMVLSVKEILNEQRDGIEEGLIKRGKKFNAAIATDPLTQEIKQIIRSSHEPSIRIDSSHSWDVLCQISTDESSKSCLVDKKIVIDLSGFQDDLNGLNLNDFNMSGLNLVFKVPAQYENTFTRKIQSAVREQESQVNRDIIGNQHFARPQIFLESVVSANLSLDEIQLLRRQGSLGSIVQENLAQMQEIGEQQLVNFIKSHEGTLIQNIALDIFPPKVVASEVNYPDLAKAYVRTQAAFVEKGVGYLEENNYLNDVNLIKNMIEFNLDLKYEIALKEASSREGVSLDLSKSSFLQFHLVKQIVKDNSNSSSAELDKAFLKLSVGADFKEPVEKAFARDFVDVALMKSNTPEGLASQLTAFQVLVRNYHAYYRNDASLTPDSMKFIIRECDAALERNLSPENTVKKFADQPAFLKSIEELLRPDRDIVSNNFSRDLLVLKNKLTACDNSADYHLINEYGQGIAKLILPSPQSLIHKQANCSDDRAVKINLFEAWCEKNSTITDLSKKISLEVYTENVSKALKIYQDAVIAVNYPNIDVNNNFVLQVQEALQSSGKAFAEFATTNVEMYPNELLRDGIPLRTFREYLLAALPDDCHGIDNGALRFYRDRAHDETKIKDLGEFVVDFYLSALQDSEKTLAKDRINLPAFLNSGRLEYLFVNPKLTTTEDDYQALSKQIIQETLGELRKIFTESLKQGKFQAAPLALSLRTLILDDALWSKRESELISRTAEKIKPDHVKVYERLASEVNRAEIPSDTGFIYRNIQKISMDAGLSPADKESHLDLLLGRALRDALVEKRPLSVEEFFNTLELKLKEAENKIFNSDKSESLVLGDIRATKKMQDPLVASSLAAVRMDNTEDIVLRMLKSPDKRFIEAFDGYEKISLLVRQEYARLFAGTASQSDVSSELLEFLNKVTSNFGTKGSHTLPQVLKHILEEVSIYDEQLEIKEVKNQIIDTPIFKTLKLLLDTKLENAVGQAEIRADIFSDILTSQMPENSLGKYFSSLNITNLEGSEGIVFKAPRTFKTIVDFRKMSQDLLQERILADAGFKQAQVKLSDFVELCNLIEGDGSKDLGIYEKYKGLVFSTEDLKYLTSLKSLLKLEEHPLKDDVMSILQQDYLKYSYTNSYVLPQATETGDDVKHGLNRTQQLHILKMIEEIQSAKSSDEWAGCLEELKLALGPVSEQVVKGVRKLVPFYLHPDRINLLPGIQDDQKLIITEILKNMNAGIDSWENKLQSENIRIGQSLSKSPVISVENLIDDEFLNNHLNLAIKDNLTPAGLSIDLDLFKQFRTDLLLLQLQTPNSTESGDSNESIKDITEKFIKANLINIFPEADIPVDNPKNIEALGKFLNYFDQALSDDLHDRGAALSSLNLEPSIKAALDTPANKIKKQMQAAIQENAFDPDHPVLTETIDTTNALAIQFYLETQKLATEMRLAGTDPAGINNAVFGKLATYINQAAGVAELKDFNLLALRDDEKEFVANLLNNLGVSNKALDTYFNTHKAEAFEASVQKVFQPSSAVSVLTAVNNTTDVQALIDNAVINLLVAPDENILRAKAFGADATTRAEELRIPINKDIRQAYIEASRELINSRRAHPREEITIIKAIVSEAGAFTQNIKDENPSGLKESEAQALFYGQYAAFTDLSGQVNELLKGKQEFNFLQKAFFPSDNEEGTLSYIAEALQRQKTLGTEYFIQYYLLADQGTNSSSNGINENILAYHNLNIGYEENIDSLALISLVIKGSPDRQTVAQELKEYLETKDSFLTDNVDGGKIPYINTASTHTKLQAGIDLGQELSGNSSVEGGLVENAVAEGIQAVIDSIKAANGKDPTVKLISNNYPSGALAGIITKSIFGEAQNLDASVYQLYKDSGYDPEVLKQTETILVGLNNLAKAGKDFKLCPAFQAKCAELKTSWEDASLVNLKANQNLRLDFAITEEVKLNNDDLTLVKAYVNLRKGFSTAILGSDPAERDSRNFGLIEEFQKIYHEQNPDAEYNAENPAYLTTLEALNGKYSSIVEHHGTALNAALVKNITDFIKESDDLLIQVSNLAQAELIKIFKSAEIAKSQPATDEQKITEKADAYVKTYNQMQVFYRQNPASFEDYIDKMVDAALNPSTSQGNSIAKANGLLGTFANIIQVLDGIFEGILVGSPKANFTPLLEIYNEIRQEQGKKLY
jgi:hypothetical protein